MNRQEKNVAIVLAAGKGARMNSSVHKQYLLIQDKPVLYYSLKVFEECPFMDEVILVTGRGEEEYCKSHIVDLYGFHKVRRIVPGGGERYASVYEGLQAIDDCTYVYIHDGARPFISQEILQRAHQGVREYDACVVGMPVKDTIKISDSSGFAESTPRRDLVWMVQTPQVFVYSLIKNAYSKIMEEKSPEVTDDAMVLERVTGRKVRLIPGSYDNIKITTPEDLSIAETFCKKTTKEC